MSNTTFFNRNEYRQQRHKDRADIRRKALDEVDDDSERQRELEARKLADRKALRNAVQPGK
jgi:hypothetical protein